MQIFLWLGLTSFLLDVLYQLGRMGLEHTLAKWAIMLGLGLLLVLFVALNEKKRIVAQLPRHSSRLDNGSKGKPLVSPPIPRNEPKPPVIDDTPPGLDPSLTSPSRPIAKEVAIATPSFS